MTTERPITDLLLVQPTEDLRWAGPTHRCVCGSDLFGVVAAFEEGVVAMYFTDVKCVACGALLRAPTEIDREETSHDRRSTDGSADD